MILLPYLTQYRLRLDNFNNERILFLQYIYCGKKCTKNFGNKGFHGFEILKVLEFCK